MRRLSEDGDGPVLRHKKVNNVETNKLRFLCKKNMPSNDEFIYSAFGRPAARFT